ncbi:MAG: 2-oxo-tetronate isomerase [Bryobacteraceae bacterium]|jgi:hydroxypyruvate isomerase
MPRFAANLSMMFNEVPFLDRFSAATDAGFNGVEYLFPYEHAAATIGQKLRQNKLENVLFNMPPGDWAAGERGIASIPGREAEFRNGVSKALVYAKELGVGRLHAMAGIPPADANPAACRAALVENLKYAAEELARHNIMLLLEAINTRDMPGFFVSTQAQCADICAAVNAPNMKMQLDCYHMQVMEGDLASKLRRYAAQCGHVQIAGAPNRNEPDTGEIRYEYLFGILDELAYAGWVGCEYRPGGKTADGLGWFSREFAVA